MGELKGTGRWRLHTESDETVVRYMWEVRTTRRRMNLLAPIARSAFEWNHDQGMRGGQRGLARRPAGVEPHHSDPSDGGDPPPGPLARKRARGS